MTDPVKLLVLSKDDTLFVDGDGVQGDARRRHIRYAEVLREVYGPASEIRIITYTKRRSGSYHDIPSPGLALFGTNSLHRATYLLDICRLLPRVVSDGWRPTAITTQTPWEEGIVGALLARLWKVRFLPQVHFDIMSPDWLKEHPLNPSRRLISRHTLNSADRIRVVSGTMKERLSTYLGARHPQIEVIRVGVNFTPSELSKEEAKKRLNLNLADRSLVLFVGRLTAQKNLLLWLDVASDILADLPETQFAIAGSGEMEGQLRQIITERGQTHRIHMLGPVGHTRLPDLYAAADIFLLSSHYEGSPRVVLEAAFAGVPTVSTRSGLEDLIEDQKSGFLINLGDREGLVSATKRLLLDSALRAHLGREAQQSCEAQFGLDALAARLARHWAGE